MCLSPRAGWRAPPGAVCAGSAGISPGAAPGSQGSSCLTGTALCGIYKSTGNIIP